MRETNKFSFGHSPNITACAQVRCVLACQPCKHYLLPVNGFNFSLPLEGGGNPSEQKARDAVDGRSFLFGIADHCRHLIRHLSVTPSPTGEGNRKALFRHQIFNASVGERLDLMKGSLREGAVERM